MQAFLSKILPLIALLTAAPAWAYPSYKDGSWGVVSQDGGRICVVVVNSEDKKHAFHFLIDGEKNVASIGILDGFLPDLRGGGASLRITLDFGPEFVRRLELKRRFDGSLHYMAAELALEDLDSILVALRARRAGVMLAFENGETWRIPPPKREEAASAIDDCWTEALRGIHARQSERVRQTVVFSSTGLLSHAAIGRS